MTILLNTPAFDSGDTIPARYTCDGEDISPEISWGSLPEDTASLALIFEDPDAPTGVFSHWVIYNIPPEKDGLQEDLPKDSELPWGATQGRNDFGNIGYGGPCPPQGEEHSYHFRLFALSETFDLPEGLNRDQILENILAHVIEEVELIGRYQRT